MKSNIIINCIFYINLSINVLNYYYYYNLRKTTKEITVNYRSVEQSRDIFSCDLTDKAEKWYLKVKEEFDKGKILPHKFNSKSWLKLKMFGRKLDRNTDISQLWREAQGRNTWLQEKRDN